MLDSTTMAKYEHLKATIHRLESVVVAFSSGIDSTLVLKASLEVLPQDKILAVTADSPIFPRDELEAAANIAKELGAEHIFVETGETRLKEFTENTAERCYICKRNFYSLFVDIARERGFSAVVDGTNLDDKMDDRPWLRILDELGVVSPLFEAQLTKQEIIELSDAFGLETNKPLYLCLASRFSTGIPFDVEQMKRLYEVELWLIEQGVSDTFIHHHHENIARVIVFPEDIARVAEPVVRDKLVARLESLGFKHVTLDLKGKF
ncbi:MAG: ATP-dependent sacrificial sulfur transferase LarE [Actinomycetota bacterium]|nr:ATP-dependent sacrificial sulfur transferase LarE [Actinomycetota bacterium]